MNIENIKDALGSITQGKWEERMMSEIEHPEWDYREISSGPGYFKSTRYKADGFSITGYIHPEDSKFIANAPEWLRWAVKRIEELEAEIMKVPEQIE